MINQLKYLDYHPQLVETLFKAKSAVLASNVAAPIVIVYVLSDFVDPLILVGYLFIKFIILILRLSFANRGLVALKNTNTQKTKKYLKLYLTTLFINSILLGMASVIGITHASQVEVFILAALAFGMVAGAMSTTTTVFHATILFVIPYLIIFCTGLIYFGDEVSYFILAFTLIIYLYITIPAGFRIFSSLKTNIDKNIKLKEQQEQLIKSERIASMGEILHNIAHQWRQPLSIISTATSGLVLQKENNILSDKDFIKYTDLINKNTQYLSTTIDEFRDFIEHEPIKKELLVQDSLDYALNITKSSLNNYNIKLINNINYQDKITLTMYEGELSQVIINIINNSKEAIISNDIKNGEIVVTLEKENNVLIISIKDNANGIPLDIINKIFEPYFTTKHNSQGTGLGLSSSYKIITEHLNGTVDVQNTAVGAEFTIKIKL